MKKYALLGHHISYTLSPLIHEIIYKKIGLDAVYEIVDEGKENLPNAVKKLKTYEGFNITKPHKQNIIPYLTKPTLESVNTVTVKNGVMTGYSTDGYGFTRDIQKRFRKIYGKALVLGAGGVAGVIAKELKNMGLKVYITNRTQEKAEALAKSLGIKAVNIDEIAPDFIVNCTSCGFNRGENPACKEGKTELGLVVKSENIKWAYDTIYSPPETDFLKSFPFAQKANGYGMLILQAVEADRIMCEVDIDERTEDEIYEETLKVLGAITFNK